MIACIKMLKCVHDEMQACMTKSKVVMMLCIFTFSRKRIFITGWKLPYWIFKSVFHLLLPVQNYYYSTLKIFRFYSLTFFAFLFLQFCVMTSDKILQM